MTNNNFPARLQKLVRLQGLRERWYQKVRRNPGNILFYSRRLRLLDAVIQKHIWGDG